MGILLALLPDYFRTILYISTTFGQRCGGFISTSASIGSEKQLFQSALLYISEIPGFQFHNSVVARSNSAYKHPRWRKAGDRFETELGRGGKWFKQGGRLFYATRSSKNSEPRETGEASETLTLRCLGRSTSPIRHLVRSIQDSNPGENIQVYTPEEYYPRTWVWKKINEKPKRGKTTVVLDRPIFDKFVDDVDTFLGKFRSGWYEDRGLIYRRGYLFHGYAHLPVYSNPCLMFFRPPGNGKTTLAQWLASEYDMNLYMLQLSNGLGDAGLVALMADLPFGSILLLEDIDVRKFSRDSDDCSKNIMEQSGVTLSGLLNAIDGFFTPNGHVLIITTNEPEKLDPALRRSGRIDYEVEFTNASQEQVKRMFVRMFDSEERNSKELDEMGEQFAGMVPEHQYSLAELQEFFLTRMTPQEAILNVNHLTGQKNAESPHSKE